MTVQLGRQHRVNTEFLIEFVAERQGWDVSSRKRGDWSANDGRGQTALSNALRSRCGKASSAEAFSQSSLLFSLLLLFGQQAAQFSLQVKLQAQVSMEVQISRCWKEPDLQVT